MANLLGPGIVLSLIPDTSADSVASVFEIVVVNDVPLSNGPESRTL